VPESRGPLWTRPTTAKPEKLTRERVVATAVALADREGFEAVSVRRIASELQARPMSLYAFFARKDDLIDLMVDHVLGEMLIEEVPADWRTAIRAIVRRQLEVGRQHGWIVGAIGQRVLLGPNAARHVEQSHAAIAGLGLDKARSVRLLRVVDVYLWGFATLAGAEQTARRRDDLSEEEWQKSTDDYFENLTADGDFPHLAEAGRAALLSAPADDWLKTFDEGLDWILDGFAATLTGGS
jgi:AcrR family transcriptional regulator